MIRRLPGFTLIETLVTLVIASLLLGLTFGLIHLASRAQNNANTAQEQAEVVVLRQAVRRLFFSIDPNGAFETEFQGTSDRMTFIGQEGLDAIPESAATGVAFTLSDNLLTLRRAALNETGTELFATTETAVFDGRLSLFYLESCTGGGIWVETWQSAVPPLALKLTGDDDIFWPNYIVFRPIREGDVCDPT